MKLLNPHQKNTLSALSVVPASPVRLLGAGLICLSLGLVSTASLAQGTTIPVAPHEAKIGDLFDTEANGNAIGIGKKGKAKHQYKAQHKKTASKLELTLQRQGGQSRSMQFSYDEANSTISIKVADKTLSIVIDESKEHITIGTDTCLRKDQACIVQAVKAELAGLSAEEVATAVVVLKQQLRGMKYGRAIVTVMETLAVELATGHSSL